MTDDPTPNERKTLIRLIDDHRLPCEVTDWSYESGKYDQATLTLEVTWSTEERGEFDADVVATADASEQRERATNVKDLVAQIEADHDSGAPLTDVSRVAVSKFGMSPDEVHHEIEKLRTKGEVYEPKPGCLRTT